MRYFWKRHRFDQVLASLLSIVFLSQLALFPLVDTNQLSKADLNYYTSLQQYEEAYVIHYFTGNELLSYIEVYHFFVRNKRDFQRIYYRSMEALLLTVISLGIILFYTLICFRRLKQRIPILSTSLGGHAPPELVF